MSDITKRALAQSLRNLLETKTLSHITIADIVQDCGISRMTFYYHFHDIFDLLRWTSEDVLNKCLIGKRGYATWSDGYHEMFKLLLENKSIFLNIYHSVGTEQICTYLYEIAFKLIYDVVDEIDKDKAVHESDRVFICTFYKYAFVGIILNWIENDMREKPETIVNNVNILINGTIYHAVESFSHTGFTKLLK